MLSPFAYALHRRMAGYQTEMLHHFQELLKIPSVRGEGIPGAPFGRKNREALDYVLRLSEQFGLTTVNLDGYLGYSEYGSGEEYVCSISHLDVVPPGEGWKHPPFGAWEENGVIYARGAGDNKPGSIAGLYALRCMKELGYEPKHKVRVIYGCAEETGMEDLEYYWKSQPLPIFGFTPDSDGYDIINAEKGRMEVCLKAYCTEKNPVVRIEGGLASNMVPTRVTAVFDRSCMTSEECCRMEMLRASQEIEWQEKDNQCVIEFRGVAAHAAMPETGHSAISEYARFACKVLNSVYTRSGQNSTPNSNATNLHSSQKRCCSFCISSSNASPTFQVQKSIFHQMTKPIQVTVILPLLLAISFSRNDDIHSSISGISNDLIGVIPTIGQ